MDADTGGNRESGTGRATGTVRLLKSRDNARGVVLLPDSLCGAAGSFVDLEH